MQANVTQPQYPPFDAAELEFHGSLSATIGVELELQILAKDTGELAPGATRILDAAAEEELMGVDGEFLMSMVEVKTGICRDTAEVRDTFFPLLRRLRNLATAVGYDLALGGTHPFSRASQSAVSPGERYQRIRKRQGWLAYHEAIYGLHVHVGVPDAERAIGLINLLTPWLPHLLALSANSPFWQGVDTEFASCRATLFRPSAHAGIPLHFEDWSRFGEYYELMRKNSVFGAMKDLYWDLRPRPDLGTIEFRICDAPASLSHLLALTSLIRCLVLDGLHQLDDSPSLAAGHPGNHWLATENKTLAARYGTRAVCVREPGARARGLTEDLDHLIERLQPSAHASGEDDFLLPLHDIAHFESGAERQRRLYRQTGDWHPILDEMKTRWVRELDDPAMRPQRLEPPRSSDEGTIVGAGNGSASDSHRVFVVS
jgi:carboxylate-amine ligase